VIPYGFLYASSFTHATHTMKINQPTAGKCRGFKTQARKRGRVAAWQQKHGKERTMVVSLSFCGTQSMHISDPRAPSQKGRFRSLRRLLHFYRRFG